MAGSGRRGGQGHHRGPGDALGLVLVNTNQNKTYIREKATLTWEHARRFQQPEGAELPVKE